MPFGGAIVNRVREPCATADDAALEAELADAARRRRWPARSSHDVADRNLLAERDARNIERMRARADRRRAADRSRARRTTSTTSAASPPSRAQLFEQPRLGRSAQTGAE